MAPIHCQETRKFFAVLARGELGNAMASDFYADLRSTTTTQCTTDTHLDTDQQVEEVPGTPSESDSMDTSGDQSDNSCLDEVVVQFRESLEEVGEDMLQRVREGDHNFTSGLTKFITSYKKMQKSHAPTSAIAYVFHSFGRSDSESKKYTISLHSMIDNHTLNQSILLV